MPTGRLLGIDVGGKRIGVAVSDDLGLVASPVAMVPRGPRSGREIRDHATRLGVVGVVVGLPVGMSGREGPQAAEVREFIASVASELDVPVTYWDERLTTSIAEKTLIASGARRDKRKSQVDAMAAAVILQGYLDSQQWAGERR
jgi:putative Holliday junction resolvase